MNGFKPQEPVCARVEATHENAGKVGSTLRFGSGASMCVESGAAFAECARAAGHGRLSHKCSNMRVNVDVRSHCAPEADMVLCRRGW